MSRSSYTPFQKHLLFFSTSTSPPKLTFLSGLRACISLGLDFPVSLALSLSLQIMYAPYPYFWSPIIVDDISLSTQRTQLSSASLPKTKSAYTCSELLQLLGQGSGKSFLKHKIDQGHIVGFWTMAADAKTHMVSREDVERFQEGGWEGPVVERRKGRNDVLPLWRGGPIWASGHSWTMGKMFGVRVYENTTPHSKQR